MEIYKIIWHSKMIRRLLIGIGIVLAAFILLDVLFKLFVVYI